MKFWSRVAPYVKVALAAVTGATLVVLAPVVFAQVVSLAGGGTPVWPAATVLWKTWGAAALVTGTAYWAHSPKGREVWTDEQREAMKDLKEGKL